MTGDEQAKAPEEVTRLVSERLNAGDAAGVAALYEPGAVLAYPADQPTTGREAIQALYQRMVDAGVKFGFETPLPTVRFEDLALTRGSAGAVGARLRSRIRRCVVSSLACAGVRRQVLVEGRRY